MFSHEVRESLIQAKLRYGKKTLGSMNPPKLNIAESWVVVFVVLEIILVSFQMLSVEHVFIMQL